MIKEQQTPFSMWNDMNEKMLEAWNAWVPKVAPMYAGVAESVTENPFNAYYEYFTKGFPQNPFLANMPAYGGDYAQQMYKSWIDGVKNMSSLIPNQSAKEGFDRFMSAFNVFSGLQNYWDKYLKNLPTDMKGWEDFSKTAMLQYQEISKNLAMTFAPEQIKSMLAMPLESFSTVQQTLEQVFKPWLEDSKGLQETFVKALQGDKDAHGKFLEEWAKLFKASASKMLNVPAVGANRAAIEKMMKLLDDYVRFSVRYGELNSFFSGMMSGAMEKIIDKLSDLYAKGEQPQTFMEFYKLWSEFNGQAAAELYSTDEFTKIMNETVSAGSKLQIMFDDFMQDLLAFLPLPNRRELDDVELEVYKLRKTVKTLEKEIKELKALTDKAKPAASGK